MNSSGKRRLRIDSLLNRAAEAVFVVDPQRRLVYFNPAAELLTGFAADQVIGLECVYRSASGRGEPADLAASLAPPPEAVAGTQVVSEAVLVRPDGDTITPRVQFIPLFGQSGKLLAVVGLIAGQAERDEDRAAAGTAPAQALGYELRSRLARLRHELYRRFGTDRLVAVGEPMRRVLEQVRLAAQTDVHFMVWGESGVGKASVARCVHEQSGRRAGPFVILDCQLLPPDSLEQDLFGTGPQSSGRPDEEGGGGLIEKLAGGTLLLRNIDCLPRDLQSRLLERLGRHQSASEQRVGQPSAGPQQQPAERTGVRIIGSYRGVPATLLENDTLRPELYYALTTVTIRVPPLRQRRAELPLLAQSCLEAANAAGDKQVSGLSAAALELLQSYDWPGNLRELDQAIRSAHARCRGTVIEPQELPLHIREPAGASPAAGAAEPKISLDEVLLNAERRLIELALQKARGNKSRAAQLLTISRPRLYRRMVQLGLEPSPPAPAAAAEPSPPAAAESGHTSESPPAASPSERPPEGAAPEQ